MTSCDKPKTWGSIQKFQAATKRVLEVRGNMKKKVFLFWPSPMHRVWLLGWYNAYGLRTCPSIQPVRKHWAH